MPVPSPEPPLIAHVIFRFDVGGLENGLVNLINAMPAGRYRHAIVCIDRSTDFRSRLQRDDVEIVEIRKRPGRDWRASWRLFRTLRRLRPAIVHSRNLGALDALLPALIAGVRHRIHGEHGWEAGDPRGESRRSIWLRKLHAPLISRYVAVSSDLRDYLVRRIGISRSRITVIRNGVDTERFKPREDSNGARAELSPIFARENCVVAAVGRMDPVKGHSDLASAFVGMLRDDPECARARLAIIGDGPQREPVQVAISEAGLAEFAWLPGRRDDIRNLVPAFDVFVLPSLAEGISNTLLEAMACGLPAVATAVGGNPELVVQGETGQLVPAAQPGVMSAAISRYVRDPDLRAAHGRAARERAVEHFSISRMLEAYLDLYDATLNRAFKARQVS